MTSGAITQSNYADDEQHSIAFSIIVTELPNLVPQNINLISTTVAPGGSLTVNWTLANTGSGSSPGTVTGVRINQSTSSFTGTTLANVSMPALNANSSTPQSATITVPTTPGTYYVWIIADNVTSGAITQSNYGDDEQHSVAFTVTGTPPATIHGIDYRDYGATATSGVDVSGIVAAGKQFVCEYIGTAENDGYLRPPDVTALTGQGLQIVSIFERTPTSVSYFTLANADYDAAVAINAASLAGQPSGSAIYFTVDYAVPSSDFSAIDSYFQEIRAAFDQYFNSHPGISYKIGVYAPGNVLPTIMGDPNVGASFSWVAEPWGYTYPSANLAQTQNGVTVAGMTVDLDEAYTTDFGQWPASTQPIAATPTITPPGGNFSDSVQITLSCTTSGATIRYTTDGSDPSVSSTIYSVPFTLTSSVTVKAKAYASGYTDSVIASANFTVTPTPVAATPTISPAGGNFSGSVQVTLACSTSGATIHYTTDGNSPTVSSPAYVVPFSLTSSVTVKAKAFAGGYNSSDIASASFTVTPVQTVATPTITPAEGSFIGSVQVTLACTTSGATIRYTTDGNDPTGSSPAYAAPFTLTSSATVKAKGFASGYNDSGIASASFTVTPPVVAAPTISPAGGSFNGSVQVTLACATSGSTIRFTTDGSNPTSGSPLYAAPFTITSSATVKAKAFASGYTDSAVASASFSIVPISTVATPTITPASGSFSGSVQVTLSCATPSATIRYTTDGNDPTGSSLAYAGPFTLTSSQTVKAKAFKTGYNDSAVAAASFTIIPLAITGIGGGAILPPNSGIFQMEFHSDQAQIIIQTSDDMVHWVDVGTFNVVGGKVDFVDGSAGANTKHFYRLKQ